MLGEEGEMLLVGDERDLVIREREGEESRLTANTTIIQEGISTEFYFSNDTTTTLHTGETREKRVRVLEEDEFEQRSRALGNAFAAARFQSHTTRRTKAIVSDPPPVEQPPGEGRVSNSSRRANDNQYIEGGHGGTLLRRVVWGR